jgi:hypothetical protein
MWESVFLLKFVSQEVRIITRDEEGTEKWMRCQVTLMWDLRVREKKYSGSAGSRYFWAELSRPELRFLRPSDMSDREDENSGGGGCGRTGTDAGVDCNDDNGKLLCLWSLHEPCCGFIYSLSIPRSIYSSSDWSFSSQHHLILTYP